jgi:hypothetical protein
MPEGVRRWVSEKKRQNSGSEVIHDGYCLASWWFSTTQGFVWNFGWSKLSSRDSSFKAVGQREGISSNKISDRGVTSSSCRTRSQDLGVRKPEGTVITEVREPSGIVSVGKGLSRKGNSKCRTFPYQNSRRGQEEKNRLDLPKNSNSSHVDRLVGNNAVTQTAARISRKFASLSWRQPELRTHPRSPFYHTSFAAQSHEANIPIDATHALRPAFRLGIYLHLTGWVDIN